MPEWSKFTDVEIDAIKYKLKKKFDRAMKLTLLLTPLICLVAPYFPARRGRKRMIEKMDYDDAVLQFAIIWLLALIGIWIWNNYKTNKQFSENRKFLRKKHLTTVISRKEKSIFKSFDNLLITDLEGELEKIEIDKEQSKELRIGETIQVEYEEQTKTVLKIEKLAD